MKSFVCASYQSMEIIDPQHSLYNLLLAKKVIEETYSNGGKILFFTSQPGFLRILQTFFPKDDPQLILLDSKWIPGLLTNWSAFTQSLSAFESRAFFVHQRKTFLRLEKRYKPFKASGHNSKTQVQAPDLLLCFEAKDCLGPLTEAFRLKIPSIAIANTEISIHPSKITYLIPGNDRSFKSLYFFSRVLLSNFTLTK
jgi:ribosomal protein S2